MNQQWRADAVCAQVDPELFFPVGLPGSEPYKAQVRQAKNVCASCPVRQQCLADALTSLPHGVAGGLSAEERAALRREAAGGTAWFADVDVVMVDRLVASGPIAGATRLELADAAAVLVRTGWSPSKAAEHLRVRLTSVQRWLASADTAASSTSEDGAA